MMAEFYSSNLSAEVKKGMHQKAKSGGCPGRAPIGYRNTREAIEGKSIARVVVDEKTAALVQFAFRLYATGNYSLTELRDILERRGLRALPWGNRPSKPISRSQVAHMLSNKFYIGIVKFKDIEYQGLHEPIIDKNLFYRVQETFKARDQAGERKRKRPHYLKGTLFCGECGSKLSILWAKGKYGYFYCLGQKRHNGCTQPYFQVDVIEDKVEKLYKKMQITPEWTKRLEKLLENEIVSRSADALREQKLLTKEIDDLTGKR